MASNQSVTYTLLLNSNVKQYLTDAEKAAKSLDSSMAHLGGTINNVATYLAAREVVNIGKEWLQTAADYENAIIRIKNISKNEIDGFRNALFINSEVDKFKIPLQEATDAYGKFLAMVRGSGLAADQIRKLHDEVLMIGKIAHIDNSQMDAAVRNLGKMLEVGALDARHFFFLEQQLSGIGAYVARNLGVSLHELAKMRHEGELTGLDAKILIKSIEDMAADLGDKLPESLASLQSQLNETSNAWERFKISVGESPEMRIILEDVKQFVYWIGRNRDEIFTLGKFLIQAGGIILGYKAAMAAASLIQAGWLGMQRMFGAQVAQNVVRIKSQTAATDQMVAAIERLNFVMNANTSAFITNAQGITMANTAANRYIISAQGMQRAKSANPAYIAPAGPTAMQRIGTGVMAVAIVAMAADVVQALGGFGKTQGGRKLGIWDFIGSSDWADSDEGIAYRRKQGIVKQGRPGAGFSHPFLNDDERRREEQVKKQLDQDKGMSLYDALGNFRRRTGEETDAVNRIGLLMSPFGSSLTKAYDKAQDAIANDIFGTSEYGGGVKGLKTPKASSIKGNSVTNINISINELNGQKQCTFTVKSMKDMEDIERTIGVNVAKVLTQAVNDSQVIAK